MGWLGSIAGIAVGMGLVAEASTVGAQQVLDHPLTQAFSTDFTRHAVPLDEIVHGGPSKDGIPAIDLPKFVPVSQADRWLGSREPVAVVRAGGQVKAYPLQILIRHEIVNDEVGGVPIAVTYCPLCNTTLAFRREFGDALLDFGTTGWLRHSDLIMYDRQTETWWQQATGEGIVGEHTGESLEFVAVSVLGWEMVREQHPDALVLSRETGFYSPETYGTSPYVGYDGSSGPIRSFFRAEPDGQLPAMERVVALQTPEEAWSIPFSELAEARVANIVFDRKPVVAFWAPGATSAVDRFEIAESRDVGATAVYDRRVQGRALTFEPVRDRDGIFRDRETRSLWNLSGRAVEGELAGAELSEIPHGNHFWFAWGVFRPDTKIWRR